MTSAGYDGSIRVDSSIDARGFNAGMAKISTAARSVLANLLSGFARAGTVALQILTVVKAIALAVGAAAVGVGILATRLFEMLVESISHADAFYVKVVQLQDAFANLRGAVLGAFATLLDTILPTLLKAITWLIGFINFYSQLLAAFAGQTSVWQAVPDSMSQAAINADKLANNTKKAKKEAQGALAAFDQINVLQKHEAGANVPTASLGGLSGGGTLQMQQVPIESNILGAVARIKKIFGTLWEDIKRGWNEMWSNPGKFWGDIWHGVVEASGLAVTQINAKAAELWSKIVGLWGTFGEWVRVHVTGPVAQWFAQVWANIVQWASNAWGSIVGLWNQAAGWVRLHVTEPIKNAFGTALDWIRTKWEAIFAGLKDFVRGAFNAVLNIVNGLLSRISFSINSVVGSLNGVGGVLPGWTNIPRVGAVQVPYLAQGAVIPPNAQFLAMLGDQKNGTNIEAPAAMLEEMLKRAVESGGQNINIRFTGSLGELARILKPEIDREARRAGGSLVAGAA